MCSICGRSKRDSYKRVPIIRGYIDLWFISRTLREELCAWYFFHIWRPSFCLKIAKHTTCWNLSWYQQLRPFSCFEISFQSQCCDLRHFDVLRWTCWRWFCFYCWFILKHRGTCNTGSSWLIAHWIQEKRTCLRMQTFHFFLLLWS